MEDPHGDGEEDPINEAEELATEENTGVQPHGPEEELELPEDLNLDGEGMDEQDNGATEEEEDRCAEPFEAADGTDMAMPEEGEAAGVEDGEQHKRDADEAEAEGEEVCFR